MRRIGLIVSSLLTAGILFAAASASACDAKDSTVASTRRIELKSIKKAGRAIFTPAQATKQGQLDDRLIRPHRNYDASAGLIG